MAHPRGPFAREAVSTSPSRACYAHNIELPTFSPYQSRGLTTPNTENSDEARSSRRSQTKLDNSPLYDRSNRGRSNRALSRHRRSSAPCARIPEFYYQMLPRASSRKRRRKKKHRPRKKCIPVVFPKNKNKNKKNGRWNRPRIGRKFVEYLYIRMEGERGREKGEKEREREVYLHKSTS